MGNRRIEFQPGIAVAGSESGLEAKNGRFRVKAADEVTNGKMVAGQSWEEEQRKPARSAPLQFHDLHGGFGPFGLGQESRLGRDGSMPQE